MNKGEVYYTRLGSKVVKVVVDSDNLIGGYVTVHLEETNGKRLIYEHKLYAREEDVPAMTD